MKELTWIFEREVFVNGDVLFDYLQSNNGNIVEWSDRLWNNDEWKNINEFCLFHGSLANADRIKRELPWQPGAFCSTEYFKCSIWYEQTKSYLLNKNCYFTSISKFLNEKEKVLNELIGEDKSFFARPNSPLKEFSGRILSRDKITPASFDYGFYHDNINLEIVLSPLAKIDNEWRFIIVNDKVITGCKYEADGRKGKETITGNAAWDFAQEIADIKIITDLAYVMDICESQEKYYLLEFNPFSGADMYNCNGEIIVKSIIAQAKV